MTPTEKLDRIISVTMTLRGHDAWDRTPLYVRDAIRCVEKLAAEALDQMLEEVVPDGQDSTDSRDEPALA